MKEVTTYGLSTWIHSSTQVLCNEWCSRLVVVVVRSLSQVWHFVTPWTTACQALLTFTVTWSLLKFMSIESVMPSNLSSSVAPFSSCSQSFPASGSFLMSQLFTSGGQGVGASVSASVLPMKDCSNRSSLKMARRFFQWILRFRMDGWVTNLMVLYTDMQQRWVSIQGYNSKEGSSKGALSSFTGAAVSLLITDSLCHSRLLLSVSGV